MPVRQLKTAYFCFMQSNPNGRFVVSEDLGHYVVVEALDADHATRLARDMGIDAENSRRWDLWSGAGTDTPASGTSSSARPSGPVPARRRGPTGPRWRSSTTWTGPRSGSQREGPMALSEQVAELEKKVRELEQEVARLRALQVPCDPRPGDVWYFATNHKDGRRKDLWLMTVSRVVPDRDEVWFEDGGWNTLSGMRGPGWFLVGRKYQDGDEDRLLEKFLGR